jgi:hypothetical protein
MYCRHIMLDEVTSEVMELRHELAELRGRVDRLERQRSYSDDDGLTVAAAGRLAGRSEQCIRDWCERAGIGQFDAVAARYRVSRRRLRSYMLGRFGLVPPGL